MKPTIEQRLKRLEEIEKGTMKSVALSNVILSELKGLKEDIEGRSVGLKEGEEGFVIIDVPDVKPFKMAIHQERRDGGRRITNISYADTIEKLKEEKCRLMTLDELRAMRTYAIRKLGVNWKDVERVDRLFGLRDFDLDEWVFDCEEVGGVRWDNGAYAGVFALNLDSAPSNSGGHIGFRCCKDVENSK